MAVAGFAAARDPSHDDAGEPQRGDRVLPVAHLLSEYASGSCGG